MNVQIFGTPKCQETRKAERWFKERSIRYQFINLKEKGMSPGELKSVSQRLSLEALIDRQSNRFRDKGLRAAAFTGPLLEKMLVEDPLLLRTPIVRNGPQATVGYEPTVWASWASL